MKQSLQIDKDYLKWFSDIKNKVRSAQIRTALAANSALIEFYYDMGRTIVEKQAQTAWGDKIVERLSKDLKAEFPEIQGLSFTNLKYCKQFYNYFRVQSDSIHKFVLQTVEQISQQSVGQLQNIDNKTNTISQQTVDQFDAIHLEKVRPDLLDHLLKSLVFNIPWGHIIVVITKIKNPATALFYFSQTIENGWSRDVLALQIKSKLHERQGKSVTNFSFTLPAPMSDLAQQTLKDPYVFDFMTITKPFHEKDIENQLINHITKFMLELGKGFAFVGKQFHLEVAGNDYYIDLLFYHIRLKCYVVVELKNTKFIPEYAGKLNFYLSAVDSLLKHDDNNPTIGILLCRDKNNIEAEFALRDICKPMGVSEFELTSVLPEKLQSSLPDVKDIELELEKMNL
ncbi:MAG: PDDEXK nuclease domain-containing protein [Prevotellaceae bacterium]|jgi:predicted nuclease of restriction endonuclease-like (RecB) superfamily|nr:PDDEXK nuclease domain-containing protein [Prevotellaceae bacterium]